jgi:hypothetical protein
MVAPEPTSAGRRGSGAEEHVATSELNSVRRRSSRGGRARSHGTCDSARAHLGREARSGAEEHVVAPELSSRGGRGPGPCGSTGAHLGRKARSRAEEHVAASELNSARRRDPGPWDTWQHRSPPRQEGEVRSCRTRGSTGAHLDREERSGATGYVAACGCTSCSLSDLKLGCGGTRSLGYRYTSTA